MVDKMIWLNSPEGRMAIPVERIEALTECEKVGMNGTTVKTQVHVISETAPYNSTDEIKIIAKQLQDAK